MQEMIPEQDQSEERTRRYHRDRDSMYMAPASKKYEGLITVSFKQECNMVQVLKTSLIPEQKCQGAHKQKCQTEYGKKCHY